MLSSGDVVDIDLGYPQPEDGVTGIRFKVRGRLEDVTLSRCYLDLWQARELIGESILLPRRIHVGAFQRPTDE